MPDGWIRQGRAAADRSHPSWAYGPERRVVSEDEPPPTAIGSWPVENCALAGITANMNAAAIERDCGVQRPLAGFVGMHPLMRVQIDLRRPE